MMWTYWLLYNRYPSLFNPSLTGCVNHSNTDRFEAEWLRPSTGPTLAG